MRTPIVLSILLAFTPGMICAEQPANLGSERKTTIGHPDRFSIKNNGRPMSSRVELTKKTDTGTFARYKPFGDEREIIVRRGKKLGYNYGIEQSRRKVQLRGGQFWIVRFENILSPPPLTPNQPPLSEKDSKAYRPVIEVLFLPDAEVLIRREPEGFSEEEVARILQSIAVN